MNRRIYYFDNNATTAIAPEVYEAMQPYFQSEWGNPSSAYFFGHHLGRAIDEARQKIADLIGSDSREIVFTSCGTESDNTAIFSALETTGKRHLITSAVEHSAIMTHAAFLQKKGYKITFLPVKADGTLEPSQVAQAIGPETALVSLMYANNETGVIFPIEEIGKICKKAKVLFHTDAVQVPGKLKINVKELNVDFLSLSGHKLHAPKGTGMLYIKHRTPFKPFVIGGHQERKRRGGTENVPYIIGFGKAAELSLASYSEENSRVRGLRDRLEEEILSTIPNTRVNGHKDLRLPNTSSITFDFIEAEAIIMMFDQLGICVSSGSACTTGSMDASHVLDAMGLSAMQARGTIRFSLSRYTTQEEVDYVLEHLPGIISKLRAMSPLSETHPDNA
ncbi:MAG: cysteine desulfurase NifS [Limisphaerales bacterium]|jgi:cysteine desulfurase|nr:cysteine desulfurase NifS [Verrucomicrobiota bacterium]